MIPKYYEIIHPLLQLISKENQTRKSATKTLSTTFKLTEIEQQQAISSGAFTFENRVGWAFSYLTKAEYIEITEKKATYRITNLGLNALKNAEEKKLVIDKKYLEENSPNYLKNWQVKTKDSDVSGDTKEDEDEADEVAFNLEEEIEKYNNEFDLKLLQKIKSLTWQQFEDLCATLLERMGYGVASTRQIRVGDGGIDGEIFEDELGLKGRIYIQAKKWDNNNIQPKDMKEFLYNVRGNKGVFITTSDFSKKSEEEAQNYKEGKVALINYIKLIKLCKKHQIFCKKQNLEIFKLE